MKRFIIKLLCKLLKIIEEIIMKLLPQFCHEDGDVHLPSICEHMDKFIGADDVTIIQGTPFDPTEGVTAVDEYGRQVPWTVSPSELEDPCEVGTFTFRYMTEHFVDDRIVTVIQASAPTFEGLTNITVGLDESFGTLVGVTATDALGNAVAVTCLEGSSYTATEVGEQILHYSATDACGNVGTAERVITVEAGHFEGLTDASVNQGLGFDLRQGVTAYTYSGSVTEFSVDPDAIDACELGEQTVTYTAMGILPTERTITVLPIADPIISGVSEPIEVEPNEEFDPMDGVTATDGNGFDITADVTVREMNYRTVLYNDGLLIINEKETDEEANTALHGGVMNEYIPFNRNGSTAIERYEFTSASQRPWHSDKASIATVKIGSKIRPTSTSYWFYGTPFTSADLSNLDTSAVTNMAFMFQASAQFTALDVSHFDTSKVTNMSRMFYGCKAVTALDVTRWDVSKVTALNEMFYQCFALSSLDVSSWRTSSATTMYAMFAQCKAIPSLDLSRWDTKDVINMQNMFWWCPMLESVDISNFDTTSLLNMNGMFSSCAKLTELDLSSFDTANVTDMRNLFASSNGLKTIYASSAFVTTNVGSYGTNVFSNMSTDLVGGAGTVWSSANVNSDYAHIDGGTSNPGYFTQKPSA